MNTLLPDIEAFLVTHGLNDAAFGRMALNDPHLLADLRGEPRGTTGWQRQRPRRLWPETEARVRRFMATFRSDAAA